MDTVNVKLDLDKKDALYDMFYESVNAIVQDNADEIVDLVVNTIAKEKIASQKEYRVHDLELDETDLPIMDECVIGYDRFNYGVAWWNGKEWKTSDRYLDAECIKSWRYIDPQE